MPTRGGSAPAPTGPKILFKTFNYLLSALATNASTFWRGQCDIQLFSVLAIRHKNSYGEIGVHLFWRRRRARNGNPQDPQTQWERTHTHAREDPPNLNPINVPRAKTPRKDGPNCHPIGGPVVRGKKFPKYTDNHNNKALPQLHLFQSRSL